MPPKQRFELSPDIEAHRKESFRRLDESKLLETYQDKIKGAYISGKDFVNFQKDVWQMLPGVKAQEVVLYLESKNIHIGSGADSSHQMESPATPASTPKKPSKKIMRPQSRPLNVLDNKMLAAGEGAQIELELDEATGHYKTKEDL